ncbi:androgen-dependent TFPI-regulating protein-like [Thrips palmi]|uniref:Androgen-dependent TFPI-regulating protein-like n=1 Tax=Thrips palmi TaxID=161013 RepID=A0A6P8ZBN8_THRPL|nr:androgen-dependent TFPI-regulating protein-like [Thrips palmi]
MAAAILFNTIAHATTLFYYVHILRAIAAIQAEPTSTIVRDFMDFKTKFFTMWGVAAQLVLFALCVLHDVARLLPADNAVRRGARSLRDLILVAVAAPGALTVSAMFWSLFKLDRNMVMPAELDALIPTWLNHTMHTFVVVLVVVQMLAEPHYAPSKTATLTVGTFFTVAYNSVFFYEYWLSRRWIYPVFSILSWPGRVALIGFTSVMFLTLSLVVRSFVKTRWGPPPKISHKSTKKQN